MIVRAGLMLALLLSLAAAPPTTQPAKERVTIAGETFRLDPAVDTKTRTRGLGGREKLDDHGGMLFVFPDSRRRSFWMKGCLIDIDILFLDDRGRITAVHKMKKEQLRGEDESVYAYEWRLRLYPSMRPARFAIELEAGSIDRLKLKPGQTIELDLPRLRKMARMAR
jgi:uncharacterized membrane protein (UPF0127 family)